MNRLLASLFLICVLLLNGVTSLAQRNHPKRQKQEKNPESLSASEKQNMNHAKN